MVSKRRARIAPTTEGVTPLGATRGGVKDATERVKAQAIVIFHKSVAKGVKKMVAYAHAASITCNSKQSVRNWVRILDNTLHPEQLMVLAVV